MKYLNFRWHFTRSSNEESMQHMIATGRAKIKDGTLIISAITKSDDEIFYCTVTNSEGSETLEVKLSVSSPLSVIVQPRVQTVNLGQTADLVSKVPSLYCILRCILTKKKKKKLLLNFKICSTSGFPKQQVLWFKDGKTLRSGARVRHLSTEHIRITSIVKEDKGMYQCIIKNDLESSQCSAELRLGGTYFADEVLVAKLHIQYMAYLV